MLRPTQTGSFVVEDESPVLTTRQARQGETSGHMRIVLGSSLVLALIVFAVLYFTMIR